MAVARATRSSEFPASPSPSPAPGHGCDGHPQPVQLPGTITSLLSTGVAAHPQSPRPRPWPCTSTCRAGSQPVWRELPPPTPFMLQPIHSAASGRLRLGPVTQGYQFSPGRVYVRDWGTGGQGGAGLSEGDSL